MKELKSLSNSQTHTTSWYQVEMFRSFSPVFSSKKPTSSDEKDQFLSRLGDHLGVSTAFAFSALRGAMAPAAAAAVFDGVALRQGGSGDEDESLRNPKRTWWSSDIWKSW